MTTAATTSAVNTIADSDWLWLRPETAASISDLLEAPILRDAPTITWYAAGFKNTWLRITKTDGAVQLHTFEHSFLGLVPHELPWKGFSQRTRRPDEAEVPGLTPDLSKNLYAIAQMAYVAYDAWHDNKWALHREILTILSEHVPALAQAYARAALTDGIQERPERQTQYAVHNALHEIDAIEALTDEPRGQTMGRARSICGSMSTWRPFSSTLSKTPRSTTSKERALPGSTLAPFPPPCKAGRKA